MSRIRKGKIVKDDMFDSGTSTYGYPKLNAFPQELYINDFNLTLYPVLEEFCKSKGFRCKLIGKCCLISAPQEEYEKYIEQLKLFYL